MFRFRFHSNNLPRYDFIIDEAVIVLYALVRSLNEGCLLEIYWYNWKTGSCYHVDSANSSEKHAWCWQALQKEIRKEYHWEIFKSWIENQMIVNRTNPFSLCHGEDV